MSDNRIITSIVILAMAILVSCSGNDSDSSPDQVPGALFYEAIDAPGNLRDTNIAMINYTNMIRDSISECMYDKGFDYVALHLDPKEFNESFGIGLNPDEFADQIGFGIARSFVANAELDSRFRSEEQKNLNSAGSEQSEAYLMALGADLSWSFGWGFTRDIEGCAAEAYSSVEPPQWFRYRYWAIEVYQTLDQRFEADQRSRNFARQWSNCMNELGYDEWDSQDDLDASLFEEFMLELTRLDMWQAEPGQLLTSYPADLNDEALAFLSEFTEKEIALAVPSHDCTKGYRSSRNRLYEELESAILASHPPQIIEPVVPKMPSLDSNLLEIELDK